MRGLGGEGGGRVGWEGVGKGREMTQTLYAHMNKRKKYKIQSNYRKKSYKHNFAYHVYERLVLS
jgi:hypothetical protein